MTIEQFRLHARRLIHNGEPVYGWYFVDHADESIYCVTRWLNADDIACDELWTRDHQEWPTRYLEACDTSRAETTLHWPRNV